MLHDATTYATLKIVGNAVSLLFVAFWLGGKRCVQNTSEQRVPFCDIGFSVREGTEEGARPLKRGHLGDLKLTTGD